MGRPKWRVTKENRADVWRYLDKHYSNSPGINLNTYDPDEIQEMLDFELTTKEITKLRSTIRGQRLRGIKESEKQKDKQVTLNPRAYKAMIDLKDEENEYKKSGDKDLTNNDIIIQYLEAIRELSPHARKHLLVTGNLLDE